MTEPPSDPDYKLLPHRIDWISKHDPLRSYAKYPKDPHDLSVGFETVTFSDFAAAINKTAWWLKTKLERDDELFAYCGPSDLRWSVLLVAGIKTGRAMVHVSPWTRPEGPVDLMEACRCSVMLYDEDQSSDALADFPLLDFNALRRSVRLLPVPSLLECFSNLEEPSTTFEYAEIWEEAADRSAAVFHTSGTIKSPRPIVWSHRTIALWHSMLELARRDQSVMVPDVMGKVVFTAFMPALIEGHNFQLFMPVFFGNTIVLRHPSQNLEPETVRQIIVQTSCTTILATPGLITVLTGCQRTLVTLRALETIIVVGTGLSQRCYELLCHPGLIIQNIYGESEVFPLVQKQTLFSDPGAIAFHETSGAKLQPYHNSLEELVVQQENTCIDLQGAFQDWPHYGAYATGDLFRRRSTLSDRWVYQGRKDDRIVLTQGEEIQVAVMEKAIEHHPLVKSALIYGELKPRPLLVIEPWCDVITSIQSEQDKISFLDDIWSDVESANRNCIKVSQLCRQLAIVMDVPAVQTSERSVDRKQTLLMLQEEVDDLYAKYTEGYPNGRVRNESR